MSTRSFSVTASTKSKNWSNTSDLSCSLASENLYASSNSNKNNNNNSSSTMYDPRNIDRAIRVLQNNESTVNDRRPNEADRLRMDLITFLQFFQVPDSVGKVNINHDCKRNIEALRSTVRDLLKEKGFQEHDFSDILEGFESLVKGLSSSENSSRPWTLLDGGGSDKDSKALRKRSSLKRIMKHVDLKGNSSTENRVKKVSAALMSKKSSKDRAKLEDAVYDTYKDTIRIFWKRPQIGYELHPVVFKRYHKLAKEYLAPLDLYEPPKHDFDPSSDINPYTKAHRPVLRDRFSDFSTEEKKAIVNFLFHVQDRKRNPRTAKQKSSDLKLASMARRKKKSKSSQSDLDEIKRKKAKRSISKLKFVIKSLNEGKHVKSAVIRGYYVYAKRYNIIPKNVTIREFTDNPVRYLKDVLSFMQSREIEKSASGGFLSTESPSVISEDTPSETFTPSSHYSSSISSTPARQSSNLSNYHSAKKPSARKSPNNPTPKNSQRAIVDPSDTTSETLLSLSSIDTSGQVMKGRTKSSVVGSTSTDSTLVSNNASTGGARQKGVTKSKTKSKSTEKKDKHKSGKKDSKPKSGAKKKMKKTSTKTKSGPGKKTSKSKRTKSLK